MVPGGISRSRPGAGGRQDSFSTGLGNVRIIEPEESTLTEGEVLCRERLAGLLKSYYREVA